MTNETSRLQLSSSEPQWMRDSEYVAFYATYDQDGDHTGGCFLEVCCFGIEEPAYIEEVENLAEARQLLERVTEVDVA